MLAKPPKKSRAMSLPEAIVAGVDADSATGFGDEVLFAAGQLRDIIRAAAASRTFRMAPTRKVPRNPRSPDPKSGGHIVPRRRRDAKALKQGPAQRQFIWHENGRDADEQLAESVQNERR